MIPKEILKRIRRIDLKTRRLVNDIFSGEYHSVFKGRGVEFSEVREYAVGDDVRTIDWNVTARMNRPYVKLFEEERELTVMLLFDISSSGEFGSVSRLKRDIAAEICAVLAFSAIQNNDKVGLILFTDTIEKFIPPKKGKRHILRILRELLYYKPQDKKTDIAASLEFLLRVTQKRTISFLVSDFIAEGYEKPLAIASRKHDIIPVVITDPREISLPSIGLIELEDAETGEMLLLDTKDMSIIKQFSESAVASIEKRKNIFNSVGLDTIEVSTDTDYLPKLVSFFRRRERRL